MGRNKFSAQEIKEIKGLLRRKNSTKRFGQKMIRHVLRVDYEFNISDFNEPGKAVELETHRVALTEATIEANKRFFDGNEDLVPKQAYTMGIKTIMQARKVLVVANGLATATAVKAVVSGPVTPECPGSILQMHTDCILVADEEALSLL